MDQSLFINQISFELNRIEEKVLEQILRAANDHDDLSPQRIVDQLPYSPEVVSAAIDKLLKVGLVKVYVNDDLMG